MSLLVASPVLFLISSIPTREGDRPRGCHHQGDMCGEEPMDDYVCKTEECRRAASRILASMNWRYDPCRDFYKFACGGWSPGTDEGRKNLSHHYGQKPELSFNTIQKQVDQQIQQLLTLSSSSGPFQKLGLFYNSCLKMRDKRTSTAPMFALLNDLGGYLMPGTPQPPDLTPLLTRLLLVNGAPLFDVYLERDVHNRTFLAVFLDLPRRYGHTTRLLHGPYPEVPNGILSVHRTVRTSSSRIKRSQNKESRAYTYIKDSAEEKRLLSLEKLLHRFLPSNMPLDMRIKEAQSILLFASMLSKVFPREKDIINSFQRRDDYKKYNLSQLQEIYGFVQWKPLMDEIFATNFTDSDKFYVVAPEYFESLQKMLTHFQNRVVHNALLLVFARDILHELVNATATPDWSAFCTRVTISVFTKAVSALYVQQFSLQYLEELRKQVTQMFRHLKVTLETRIRSLSWLDELTREEALHKLSNLRGQFFTWPQLWNQTYVASLLQDVHVDPDDFFGNVIRRYRQLRTTPHNFHDQLPTDQKWAYPFVVNAFYELTLNSIVIPLAVLTQPYFRADVPHYIPYATIGLIFTHEMLHGFDLIGIGYDAKGEPREWFSPESRLRLEARLDCVARQYAATFWKKVNFMGANIEVQFDWNVTQNENMADISGLQIAYKTWKLLQEEDTPDPHLPGINLSPRQLFFLNAAQTYCSTLSPEDYILLVEMDFHTPFPERVNGIMMNSPSFAEAYNCPVGLPMNPSRKCSTW
ncbi:Endothelin-converting enzyme-like 1 [Zootermopsis nevadensis]|uniref:Endothelin-converting enzyme-like 1 n=2 Tax=Zootermopsis nevadensis TaxID=136037 RepID=A0A067RGD6_ZOONE|nr:Endothelin-converting enzyme-like 1 [Zootermopsis nevadensis]